MPLNQSQVEAIEKLRAMGRTPSKIARSLKITVDQVTEYLEIKEGNQTRITQSSKPNMTLEDYFEEAIRRQEWKERTALPYHAEVHHEFKDNKPIAVTFFSDIHLGSSGVDYRQLRDDVQAIHETEGMYVVHNGDEINNFVIGRLSALSRHDAMQPDEQWQFVRLLFERLASKTLAATRGNHTDWTPMLSAIDYRAEILGELDILDISHGGKIHLDVAGANYTIMARHKFRYESSSNQYNAVVKMYELHGPFDVGVIGHTHTSGIANFNRQGNDFICVRPGSYKIKDEYAHEWGYQEARCISPTVVFFPGEKRVVHFENCQDAAAYLKFLRTQEEEKTNKVVVSKKVAAR